MSFLNQFETANNAEFLKRVRVAIVKTAHMVIGETSSGNPDTDTLRYNLAMQILQGMKTSEFALSIVAVTGTITETSSDGDIEWGVTTVFNDIAGVR